MMSALRCSSSIRYAIARVHEREMPRWQWTSTQPPSLRAARMKSTPSRSTLCMRGKSDVESSRLRRRYRIGLLPPAGALVPLPLLRASRDGWGLFVQLRTAVTL